MADFVKVNDQVIIGRQPSEDDLRRLADQGVKTVIDFRHPQEPQAASAASAARVGLQYVNIPVVRGQMTEALMDGFRQALARHPGPYLLHCGLGPRATAMWLAKTAIDKGRSAEEAFAEAERQGLPLNLQPDLKAFFIDYINRHSRPPERAAGR